LNHPSDEDQGRQPINWFEDYEKIRLNDNVELTKKYSHNSYNRWPQSRGYFAMPEGTVAHELGHAMHFVHADRTKRQWFNHKGPWSDLSRKQQQTALKHLSRYGTTNAAELTAEVFSRLIHHQPVSPEMLQLYHNVGGHPLKVDRIPQPAWRY
jgi:hypothetical protein